jgi:hypothetical protein
MAAPFLATIFGTPMSAFGSAVAPGGSMGRDVSSYTPDSFDMESNGSYEPSDYSSVARFEANTFIQHSYILMPFQDESETRIMENMLVFGCRHVDHKHGLTPIVSIGKFNNILRESHELFNSMVQAGQPEAVEFNGYLRGIGENNLEYYHYLLSTNNSDKITEFRGANVGIQRFYSLATQDVYRYQTIFGITSQWNFLGVALAKSEATSLASLDMTRSTSNVYVLNVVVGEKAQVFNYWGTIKTAGVGCRVFLVLRRVKLPNDAWGQFQVTTASYSTWNRFPAQRAGTPRGSPGGISWTEYVGKRCPSIVWNAAVDVYSTGYLVYNLYKLFKLK